MKNTKRKIGATILLVWTLLLWTTNIFYFLQTPHNIYLIIYQSIVPTIFTFALVVLFIYQAPREKCYSLRTSGWVSISIFIFIFLGLNIILFQSIVGGALHSKMTFLTNLAASGGLFGLIIGVYDSQRLVQSTQRQKDNKKQRKRLSIINRVLRHNVRTQLNIILGFLEMLPDSTEKEKVHTAANKLEKISEKARVFSSLIDAKDASIEKINISQITEEEIARLQKENPGTHIKSSIEPDVTVDTTSNITHAVQEILENAIKHGGRIISVKIKKDKDYGLIIVRDNGPGVPTEEKQIIKSDTETQLEHSNGLGLWIAEWVASLNNGEMKIHSGNRKGSEVVLYLPLSST